MKLWLYILIAIALATGAFIAGYSYKEATTYDSISIIVPIELPDNYTSQSIVSDNTQQQKQDQYYEAWLIEKLKHGIWHLQQKQDQYYEAWQDCFQELIDSGLYEVDIEVSGEGVTLRSYKKVPYVEVFRELTDWDSIKELEAFLEQDDTDQRIVLKADSEGIIKFNNQCEDYALQLRDRAMAQGKHLSVAIVELGDNKFHALCMARIGNEFWYIEPKTDECWLFCYLD